MLCHLMKDPPREEISAISPSTASPEEFADAVRCQSSSTAVSSLALISRSMAASLPNDPSLLLV